MASQWAIFIQFAGLYYKTPVDNMYLQRRYVRWIQNHRDNVSNGEYFRHGAYDAAGLFD